MRNTTNLLLSKECQPDVLVVVPLSFLNDITQKQEELLSLLKGSKNMTAIRRNYISSDEAMVLLKRGTTWFWNMRKQGKLSGKKVGGKRHYSMEEIEKLFNQ